MFASDSLESLQDFADGPIAGATNATWFVVKAGANEALSIFGKEFGDDF